MDELFHQINVVRPSLIITHSSCLDTALAAAQAASLPPEHVITLDDSNQMTVEKLIQKGLRSEPNFVERKLRKGEAKTKVAFLSFSSGTTGKPKVRLLLSGLKLSRTPTFGHDRLLRYHTLALLSP